MNVTTRPTPSTRLLLPTVLGAQLVTPLAIAGTALTLPDVADDLGTTPFWLQGVVNGFNVAFALGTLLFGARVQRHGPLPVLLFGSVLAGLGALLSAVTWALPVLDLARLAAGLGSGAVIVGSSAMLSSSYAGAARTRAFAAFGTANGIGLAFGPSVSGLLVAVGGWRLVFSLHALVLVAVVAALSRLQDGRRPGSEAGGDPGADDAGPDARRLLDLRPLRVPRFVALCLVPVAASFGFVTLLTYLPNALNAVSEVGPAHAGLLMLGGTVPVLVGPPLAASLTTRVDGDVVLAVALLLLAGGVASVVSLDVGHSATTVLPGLVAAGLGFGLTAGLVDGLALAALPARLAGAGAGLLNFFRIGSEALAVAAYAAVLSALVRKGVDGVALAEQVAAGGRGDPHAYAEALHVVVLASAGVVLVSGTGFVLLRRRRASVTTDEAGVTG